MQITTLDNMLECALAYKYPNQYVVLVDAHEECFWDVVTDQLKIIQNKYDNNPNPLQYIAIDEILIVCDNKSMAEDIFDMFNDETKFPYTILFGPVPSQDSCNGFSTEQTTLDYFNKIRQEYPNGMILSENT